MNTLPVTHRIMNIKQDITCPRQNHNYLGLLYLSCTESGIFMRTLPVSH